jgi:hypothetical protein
VEAHARRDAWRGGQRGGRSAAQPERPLGGGEGRAVALFLEVGQGGRFILGGCTVKCQSKCLFPPARVTTTLSTDISPCNLQE